MTWDPPPPKKNFDVVISDSSDPKPPVYGGANTQAYVKRPPCLDSHGHYYQARVPSVYDFEFDQKTVAVCIRCGDIQG